MRAQHECFSQPENIDVFVWRYMDLARFVSFIQESSIYFSRADLLGDPFEGSISHGNRQINALMREIRKIPDIKSKMPGSASYFDLSDEDLDKLSALASQSNRRSVQELFVSCWHQNEFESAAMWSQYGPRNSLCVRTTYRKLVEAVPEFIHVGVVKYVDYKSFIIPQGNIFHNIMHKRKSFDHKREIRAVFWKLMSDTLVDHTRLELVGDVGVKIKIDLANFIDQIFISPEAPAWFKPLVDNLLQKYEINKKSVSSEIGGSPLY